MTTFKIIDKNGAPVQRGLTMDAATSMVEILMTANPAIGAMKIVPDVPDSQMPQAQLPAPGVPPLVAEMHSRRAQTLAEAAQAVEPGQERENLQSRIDRHAGLQEVVTAAEEAAAKASERVKSCGAEVERLKGLCQAEIDTAAAALAESIKSGTPQGAESNLGAQRAALLNTEAQHAAAEIAQRKLDEELQAARNALATAEREVEVAVGLVVKAHLHEVAQELDKCWARANELRNLLDSSQYAGFPLSLQQLDSIRPPEPQPVRFGPQIARWKRALMQDAGAQFDDQLAKVAA